MDPLLRTPDDVRVLHVDDEPSLCELVAEMLAAADDRLTVSTVTGPEAALAHLADERVDCVVSDFAMPSMDGLALLETVRERHGDLPFVLFTGQGSEEVAADALAAGADSYLQKGTGSAVYERLAAQVLEHVDRHRAERRVAETRRTYELVARAATDAFWLRDLETGETAYSEGIRRFGYEPGVRSDGVEWWLSRVHPDDRPGARELNTSQEAGDDAGFDHLDGEYGRFTYDYRWRTADGEYVACRSRGIVRFEDGDPVEMVGAMTTRGDDAD